MSSEPYRSADRAGASRVEAPDTKTLASIGTPGGPAEELCVQPPAPERPAFLPSEVLAGRFRVVRLLGRGGMGEIYEVEDLELGERVAIKTLRPRLAASDAALALFRNEIQLARRVTHLNVCRTFDAFRHRPDGAEEGAGVAFLTMELLPGETLSRHLRRKGPLPLEQALPLVRQVAAGLDAAHAAGIVHRDFKSGNVLLVGGERGAVVTDFGLAGAVAGAPGAVPSTGGTEPYRAPEQAAGRQAGPAADLHALGVVVLEMLTGRVPGGASPAVAAASGLPPEVVAVLCRCLAPRPEHRPASAMEAYRDLERAAAAGAGRHRRHLRAAVAALVALVPLLWLGVAPPSEAPSPAASDFASTAAAEAVRHPGLLVTAASGVGGDCRPCLPIILAELLKADLEPAGIEVLEPAAVYGPMELAAGAASDAPRPREWAELLGADLVVEIEAAPGGEDRPAHLLTVRRGAEILFRLVHGSEPGSSPAEDAIVLVPRLIRELLRVLGRPVPGTDPQRRRLLLGADPVALDRYAQALQAAGETHLPAAALLLAQALEREPDAFRFLLLQAGVLRGLNRDPEALEAIRRAQRIAADLGDAERIEAEAVLARVSHDAARSVHHVGRLVHRRPERIDWRILQAQQLLASGEVNELLRVVEALEERSPAHRRDPRLLLLRSQAARIAGDGNRQLRAAVQARRRSGELGLPRLTLAALESEYGALFRLGRLSEALPVADQALALARRMEHGRGIGQALRWKGNLLVELNRHPEARDLYRQSAARARETEDLEGLVWSLNNLGWLHGQAGQLETAETHYDEALVLLRRMLDSRGILLVRSNLLEIWMRRGELHRVEREGREILAAAQEADDPVVLYNTLEDLARAALERGDLEAADHFLERAEVAGGEDRRRFLPTVLAGRSRLHLERGEPDRAREAAERALATARGESAERQLARAREALGAVHEAEGRPEEAVAAFRRALDHARAARDAILAATLERRLGRAEIRRGRTGVGRRHLESALEDHRRFGSELEAAHVLHALAELHLAEGDLTEAAARAREALEAYQRLGTDRGAEAGRDLLARATSGLAASETRLAESG